LRGRLAADGSGRVRAGVSRKTQELYMLVFVARYLDLFTDYISLYNSVMKVVFITSSAAIVWCMRRHPQVRRTYDKEQDTFRHVVLIAGAFLFALIFNERFTIREVMY
jgi:ER lumen protein retaining receptor